MARTYRALAALISYPTEALQAATGEIATALAEEGLISASQLAAIDALLAELAGSDIYDLQERYFALFDRSRTLSLHLFEHVHGESRDRGQAMSDLLDLYRGYGLEPTADELPDFLPLFLEFISLLPADQARGLLAEPAGILRALAERLAARSSAYAAVFQALAILANAPEVPALETVRDIGRDDPDDLAALDAAWEEAAVLFGPGERIDGCGTDRLQTRIVPRPAAPRRLEEAATVSTYLNSVLYGWYPYLCLTVFLLGSLLRFDASQYTWRTVSSQLLRRRQLIWGSNLFHVGILVIFVGHVGGLLTPVALFDALGISHSFKQLLAMTVGGIAGIACFVGTSLLVHRRLFDARIRRNSSVGDILILLMLYAQLTLGLLTIAVSAQHLDGTEMVKFMDWAQGVVTLHPTAAALIAHVSPIFKLHLFLGMTIFLVFPFTRLVHVWSAPVWYLGRTGFQVVRTRQPVAGE